ncbi:Putative meiosis specific protein Spo22/ZIP4/TEX11 [Colletotrichum destructivum]|uniref:Meiosis specific protein Spo22/ZIP4/TEX11 n=1 Tax=Colletotrichum destructivum TaxID=34406 RepID=A0AAX4IFY8_9PEZI|nr:Putative meiosis specific protein Spo22/ZIP4/TEX11 [Colletotrichum destructivum]
MPPLTQPASPKNNPGDKLASFAIFSQTLLKHLRSANDPPAIDSLLAELKPQLEAIANFHTISRAKSHRAGLDRKGTELWNLCTRLRREDVDGVPPARRKLLLQSRIFAFFMIAIARHGSTGAALQVADVVHLTRLMLKAGKMCLDDESIRTSTNTMKLANAIFSKGAGYVADLGELQNTMLGPDDLIECKRLESEYYILRTALAWKEDNLTVAEFMYDKGHLAPQSLDPSSAEKMTEVLFEMGKDLSERGDFPMAARWLERAYNVINAQDLVHLSRDAIELRLAVCQGLVHAFLAVDTQDSSQKALELVNYVESEIGDKPVVLLLRLELLQKTPAEVFDVEAYADILRRMVRAFNFSESHFKLLVHHARKLHDKSPTQATSVVDGMLRGAMVSSGRDEWVERLVLLRIWMETTQRDSLTAVEGLAAVLAGLQDNLEKPFGASAAVGALTLIWKKIEITYSQGHFDIADSWCQVALQPLFQNGGPANMSRLGRKLILCALGGNDTGRARQAFHNMSEAAQNEPMTRYLMYKVALRSADRELATECLERVGTAAGNEPDFLYACVLEAQQVGDRVCAMQAMKQLVNKFEFSETSPVHLPALLRCNIRLAVSVMESEKDAARQKAVVEEIIVLFEGGEDIVSSQPAVVAYKVVAAKAIQRNPNDKDGNRLFTVKELDWFCQNAYNLGLKHWDSWDLERLVRLYNSCLAIAAHYPADIPSEAAGDLAFRTMFCNFVAAAALVSLARVEDIVERQLQHYLVMRRHVKAYNDALEERAGGLNKRVKDDLTAKLTTLMVFDFEAAMALKKYDALGYIIRTAKTCRDVNALKAMGDIALRGRLPGQELYSTLGVIVNEIWELEKMKGDRLAKYIRCMFQAVQSLDAALGQRLMKQAIEVARDSAKDIRLAQGQHPFPPEELEWLVTVSFNQAVDAYNVRQDDECNKWADLAMNLAHYAGDEGELEALLQENRMKLKFEL